MNSRMQRTLCLEQFILMEVWSPQLELLQQALATLSARTVRALHPVTGYMQLRLVLSKVHQTAATTNKLTPV